jgi:mannose-6-phosphate isomerase-like protein (cupin superfamily)
MTTKQFRRVVTGHDEHGRAVILEDGPPTRVYENLGQEGLVFFEVWNTQETPARITRAGGEPAEERLSLAPPKRGTRIRVLDIPVEDPAASASDLEAVFENVGGKDAYIGAKSGRHANFHRTQTIDYGIVLDGEITLLMDEGETTLYPGDICIQRGTNHGWVNRGTKPCRIAFILIDGKWEADLAPTR